MSSKTITITDSAYARLAAEKKAGESFTDVILRLTKPKAPKLSELHKLIPRESVDAWAEAIEERRQRDRAARAVRTSRNWDE